MKTKKLRDYGKSPDIRSGGCMWTENSSVTRWKTLSVI